MCGHVREASAGTGAWADASAGARAGTGCARAASFHVSLLFSYSQ